MQFHNDQDKDEDKNHFINCTALTVMASASRDHWRLFDRHHWTCIKTYVNKIFSTHPLSSGAIYHSQHCYCLLLAILPYSTLGEYIYLLLMGFWNWEMYWILTTVCHWWSFWLQAGTLCISLHCLVVVFIVEVVSFVSFVVIVIFCCGCGCCCTKWGKDRVPVDIWCAEEDVQMNIHNQSTSIDI